MNVLSQNEIDALMQSLLSGHDDVTFEEKKKETVKKYDFRTANKFTKDHIRTVDNIFRSYCHLLSNYLVGLLRVPCEIEVLSHEEVSFLEYNNSVPSPSIISVVKFIETGGNIILNISKDLAFAIVARVLGGNKSIQSDNRQFTEIELMIMERIIWQMLTHLDDAWAKVIPVNASLEKLETGMQFAQITDNNEAVLVVTMSVTLGNEQSVLSFCLPRQTMMPIYKQLNLLEKENTALTKNPEDRHQELQRMLGQAKVELSACFNSTRALADDVLRLQVGDVIQLNHKLTEPLTINLQSRPKFKATYGSLSQHYAVKIQEVIGGDN